jgi:hypothetical protein
MATSDVAMLGMATLDMVPLDTASVQRLQCTAPSMAVASTGTLLTAVGFMAAVDSMGVDADKRPNLGAGGEAGGESCRLFSLRRVP